MARFKDILTMRTAVLLTAFFFVLANQDGIYAQQRKPRKAAKTTVKKAQPERETKPQQPAAASDYEISVKIENRQNLLFRNSTSRVLVIVNRDKRPVTIRKVTLNEEYEFAGSKIKMKHSENGYVYLPVKLKLGESLENIFPDNYRKTVVYVDLETDSGVRQFKLGD